MIRLGIVVALAGIIIGCGAAAPIVEAVASAVDAYCGVPTKVRKRVRGVIAVAIMPNTIEIHCSGDADG